MPVTKLDKALDQARIGLGMVRDGHWRQGLQFFVQEFGVNSGLRLLGKLPLAPKKVFCNVCGWSGPRFLTHCAVEYADRNAFCPRCLSYPRHRAFAYWLEHDADLRERVGREPSRPGLVFAPEPGMMGLLGRHRARLVGLDLERRNGHVELMADAVHQPLVDDSLGFVFCFHVLEHIEEDVAALAEIARCLAPGACLVLSVPTCFEVPVTIEYGRAHELLNGHWYAYGLDFDKRIAAAGLVGRSLRATVELPPDIRARLAIQDEELWILESAPSGASGT